MSTDEKKLQSPVLVDKYAKADTNAPVPVKHLWFVEALDFNSEQKSNVTCGPELEKQGTSYVCQYIPQWHSFELTCGRSGKLTETHMIPRERVKRWTRAV